MPIQIKLEKTVTLGEIWIDKQAWNDWLNEKTNLRKDRLAELIEEDIAEFIMRDCGGIKSMIKEVKWVDDTPLR